MHLKEDAEFFDCQYCGNIFFPAPNEDGVRVFGETASESCPVCAIPLVRASIEKHRIRYCERCRGMLISMDELPAIALDLRSRRQVTADAVHPPDWSDLERKRRCPQCGEVLDTHLYGGAGNVIIDACERCSLVWLDSSELDRIVRAADPQPSLTVNLNTSGRA
jgi:Zn-finger nucleic acid-binding protein